MSTKSETVKASVSSDEEGNSADKSAKLNPKKEEKPPKENNKKSPVKQPKEEEGESGGNESSESAPEENNEEPKLGLLDQPVELTGSRERKKVQRLEYSITTPSKEKLEIPEGSGEKLGECPRIEFQLQKTKTDELKVLHRILFNRPGSGNEVKKNLRRFSGFTFVKGSPEYEKKKITIDKITITVLKHICEILDLERSGTKDEVSARLLDFLLSPKASGKQVPPTKKRSSKGEKQKQKPAKVKSDKKASKKKQESSGEEEASEPEENEEGDEVDEKEEEEEKEQEELEEEEEEEEEIEVDNDDEDSEAEEKKRKRSRSSKGSKDKKRKESKSKKTDEKKTTKSAKKSKKAAEVSSEESSDDEPLAKKAKGPPTDDEIKQLVKKILDGANLEEITMKKVIKQVFDNYPEYELGDKKDFIKSTVKSLIS